MSYARWAPDSRRIITISEFNIRMTVWSLIDRSTAYINFPKFNDKGISFTSNGYFMALAERKESKDYIGIYYAGDWTLVSHFPVDSYDLQDIMWSKDNTAIIIQDSLLECKFYIYSPTGNLITQHEPYQWNLGIKNLNISPNGHFLTVGFHDQAVRLYNHITWKLIIDFTHTTSLNDITNINVFREDEVDEATYSGDIKKTTKYVDVKSAIKFNVLKPSLEKPNIGVSEMSWSYDSNFLATRIDNIPNVLWVWHISTLSLHTVIVQIKPIKHFQWSPTQHILLICTENSRLYSFTLTNVYVIELVTDTTNIAINKINWNVDGKSFIVSEKTYMIIGYPEINDAEEDLTNNNEKEEHGYEHGQEQEYEHGRNDYDNENEHDEEEEREDAHDVHNVNDYTNNNIESSNRIYTEDEENY